MKVHIIRISLFLVLSLIPALLSAQEAKPAFENPAWVDYEKGMLAISDKDYGQALFHFKQALSQNKVMPEAELGIGDVYFYQGDYLVAERQYLMAFDERAAFAVPDMRYDTLYRLARLYFNDKRFGKMEETLKLIIKDDKAYSDPLNDFFRTKLVELFTNKGFDEMFRLNRFAETFATTAHAQSAYYDYRSWNFEPALLDALFGFIPLITESMAEIRKRLPDYQYMTLADFTATGLGIDSVRRYLDDRDFFKRLYYLALISYERIPTRDSGLEFLSLLAKTEAAGEYRRLARLQLKKPFREERFGAELIQIP